MSGGTKGLGLQYARNAAAAGQQCLVLSSRKPSLPQGELAALAASGAAVFVVRCSSADAACSAQVAGWVRERLPRAAIYAHAAGAPGHDMLADVTPDVWHRVVRPKVIRCWAVSHWLLHRGCSYSNRVILKSIEALPAASHQHVHPSALSGFARAMSGLGIFGSVAGLGSSSIHSTSASSR